ncbi:GAF domain-containing sensor histidine kinase [Stackebrandtia nassauensis]|uniref:GAF sensor signal transduction histidine kinase n=1 Tax=Stackebrandtia nassauensis (strain DSM 44728 / CIP 108903 / NRRL B-16338 / NBRC 102104 / LLR-40K-21) TaxID=446470 RepID=D3QAI4_STANL|nr:GAF domain-containing protein [Stackebrandtia nassauensis]ADD42767.1 GAF sensor signal transduction histidine kinase [Stackebrandtia nassauensis DSM 44728]
MPDDESRVLNDPVPRTVADTLSGLRLNELLAEVQERIGQIAATRDRLQRLLDAITMVAGDLDLDSTLRRITEAAVGLVDARYGALGVLAAPGDRNRLRSFVTVGMSEDERSHIDHEPHGEGILGLLINHPQVIRLSALNKHPDSVGFPANHPKMASFLGAPIQVRDEVFGNLYLSEKRGASEFNSDDEVVIQALAAAAGIAIENARMYEQATVRRRWLAASSKLQAELLSGATLESALGLAAVHTRELLKADTVFIALPEPYEDDLLRVKAVDGDFDDRLMGITLTAPVMSEVLKAGVSEVEGEFAALLAAAAKTPPGEFAAVLAVPIQISDTGEGTLVALRHRGSPLFSSLKLPDVVSFAQDAALAIRAAEGQRAQHLLDVLSDRERIAADLHDHVIQRLYGCGMNLQATLPRVNEPGARRRIQTVVEELDTTIREIRTSIFALQSTSEDSSGSLRRRLLDATAQMSADSKLSPAVYLSGAVDTLVPVEIADHAEAVVREAVSNAVRHAHASHIVVSAEAGDDLVIDVTDDGKGIPEEVVHSGLANMERRAQTCGGNLTIAPMPEGGTRITWQVPLP